MILSYSVFRALMVPILHSMALEAGGAKKSMKVLVTGSTGRSGSHQLNNIHHNHAGEYELHATKRARSSLDLIDPNGQEATSFHTDAFGLADLIAKTEPGIILHYAADTFIPPSSDNPYVYSCDNPKMVLNLIKAIRLARRHNRAYDPTLFIPSSLEVCGTQFQTEEQYQGMSSHVLGKRHLK
jgi:nucleoside-diphosphate-sugar epimerase